VLLRAGGHLKIGPASEGAFGYLAVAGGIDVPPVLASRSTYLAGAFGGLHGAAVVAGTELPTHPDAAALAGARWESLARHVRAIDIAGTTAASVRWSAPPITLPASEPATLRVIDGVHVELFASESRAAFLRERWRVAPESNRMGYRLSGSRLALDAPREIVSQPVCFGTVQVPAGGQPIVLMADRQTTGGYPRIAEVISADIASLAQLAPGRASVRFERVALDAADAAREALQRRADDLVERLQWEFGNEIH
jgi:antagonist of KipI